MSEAKQTKCPHCGSVFKVGNDQLAAKGGNVRCGSCLQVFRADLHLVGAPATHAPTPPPAPKPKTKASPDDESWALELLGEDHPEQDDEPAPKAAHAPSRRSPLDDDIPDTAFVAASPTGARERSIRFDDELSDLLEDTGSGLVHDQDDYPSINASADESWAQGILSELEQEENKQKQKQYGMEIIRDDQPKKAPPRNPKLAAALGHRVDDELLAAAAVASSAAPRTTRPAAADDDVLDFLNQEPDLDTSANAMAGNPFAFDRPLAHVDAPVMLKPRREPIRWGRLLTWLFLCLVALAMLLGQYLYFNFNTLSADLRYRPWLEAACAKAGCRVPEIPNVALLKIDSLLVRTHPEVPGALQVDAIIRNTATFAQPFPGLKLSFSNRHDEPVASRVLQPKEYLHGELALLRRIPPETPVRISVSLVNPGPEAVNYSLQALY